MSNNIDERITRIRFDNDQFEKGVATSLQSLDRLKNKLESTESSDGFTGIANAVDSISDKFSTLRLVAINVLSDIVSGAIDAGAQLVKSLSTDNIAAGWSKYSQEVSAVQAMAHTLGDSVSMEEIEERLEYLAWYSDETSYNYSQMTNAMGKFINNGADLDVATLAMTGFANAAASAGVSTQQAATVFDAFSDAYSRGYMMLRDWRRLEGILMPTPEIRKNLLSVAVSLGTIQQIGEDLYTAPGLTDPFSSGGLALSLSKGHWLNREVMEKFATLYGDFAQKVYEFQDAFGVDTASEAMAYLEEIGSSDFRNKLLETAAALGKIYKSEDGVFSLTKNMLADEIVSPANMMFDEWFDEKVLTAALKRYGDISEEIINFQNERGIDTVVETIKYMEQAGVVIGTVSDKAFHMGQEAKTLEEALDSVRDAVSTKWKKTFSELFGNYEDAKVLWTDLANELYDLFVASSDTRNEILKQWNDPLTFLLPSQALREAFAFPEIQTGREILIEGLWNIYYSIVNVVDTIKAAWREVFPEMTAKRLYDLTKRFRDFTARMLESTEDLGGLQSFFKIIFTGLKGLLTIGKTFLKFLGNLWPYVKNIVSFVSEVIKQVGSFFKDAFDYISKSERFGSAIEKLAGVFETVKNSILDFSASSIKLPTFDGFLRLINRIKEEGMTFIDILSLGFEWIQSKFKTFIQNITGLNFSLSDAVGIAFSWIREKFEKFKPHTAIQAVVVAFTWLNDRLSKIAENLGLSFENIAAVLGPAWEFISTGFADMETTAGQFIDWVTAQLKTLNLRDVLAVAVVGVMLWLIIRLGQISTAGGRVLEEIADFIWRFSWFFNALSVQQYTKSILNIALAVLAIAGAFALIANLGDPAKAWTAVAIVSGLAAALVIINLVLMRVSKLGVGSNMLGITWSKTGGLKFNAAGTRRTGVLAIVLGVLGLIAAVNYLVKLMDEYPQYHLDRAIKKVSDLVYGLFTFVASMKIISGIVNKLLGVGKFNLDFLYPLTVATSMLLILKVIEKMAAMDLNGYEDTIWKLVGIMGALMLIGVVLKSVNTGSGLGVLGIAVSLYLIVGILQKVQSMNLDLSDKGPIITLIAGFIVLLGWVSRLSAASVVLEKGQRFRRTSVNLIGISIALLAATGAVALLAHVKQGVFKGAIVTMALMGVLFSGIGTVLQITTFTTKYSGRGLFGLSVLLVAVSLLVTVVTIAYTVSPESARKAIWSITLLFGGIAYMVAGLRTVGKVGGTMAGLAVIIAIVGGMTWILSSLFRQDFKAAIAAVGSMMGLLISLAIMMRLLSRMNVSGLVVYGKEVLTSMAAMLLLLSGVVVILTWTAKENPAALEAAITMSLLAISLGMTVGILSAIKMYNIKSALASLIGIGGLAIVLGGVVIALSRLVDKNNLDWLKEYGPQLLALVDVIVLTTAIASLLGQGGPAVLKATLIGVAAFALVLVLIGAIATGIFELYQLLTEGEDINKIKEDLHNLIEVLYLMGASITAIFAGALLGAIPEYGKSLSEFAQNAEPFFGIISKFPDNFGSKIKSLGSGMLALMWYGSWIEDFQHSQLFANSEYVFFQELSAIGEKLLKLDDSITDEQLKKFESLEKIVEAIAGLAETSRRLFSINFFGISKVLGHFLDDLGNLTAEQFDKAVKNVPYLVDIFEPLGQLTQSFEAFSHVSFYGAIFGSHGQGFKVTLKMLGQMLKKDELPISELAELNTTELTNASNNMEKLSPLIKLVAEVSKSFMATGGVWQVLAGDRSIGLEKLPDLATSIIRFGNALLDPASVGAVEAATNVTKNFGGALSGVIDDDVISKVGKMTTYVGEVGVLTANLKALDTNAFDKLTYLASALLSYSRDLYDDGQGKIWTDNAIAATQGLADAFSWYFTSDLSGKLSELSKAISTLAASGLDKIKEQFSEENAFVTVSEAITSLVNSFTRAIDEENKKDTIGLAFKSLLDASLSTFNSYFLSFWKKGKGLRDEFIAGLLGEVFDVKTAGITIAKGLSGGTEEFLQEKSPSKKMFNDGVYAAQGLIEGITSMYDLTELAGEGLGDAFATGFSRKMGNLQRSKTFQRTISPVKRDILSTIENNGIMGAADELVGSIEGFLGEITGLDGKKASAEEILQKFIGDPLAYLETSYEDIMAEMDIEGTMNDMMKQLGFTSSDDNTFSDNPLENRAAHVAASKKVTEEMFSNMPWLQNTKEVLDENFKVETDDALFYKLLYGPDGEAGMWAWLQETENAYKSTMDELSNYSFESALPSDYFATSSDWQGLVNGATGGTVAGYTAEDIRALTTEIHGLEDALYSLKETMKDQHMIHSGEIRVKYTNESDFIDRIQTSIVNSLRWGARG